MVRMTPQRRAGRSWSREPRVEGGVEDVAGRGRDQRIGADQCDARRAGRQVRAEEVGGELRPGQAEGVAQAGGQRLAAGR